MKGLTLIELMIVIGVIVIVAVTGGLYLFRLSHSQEVGSAAGTMAAVLRDAQQRAINQQSGLYWGVRFENLSSGRDRYFLFNTATADAKITAAISEFYLKSSLGFLAPTAGNSLTILFAKISGNWVSAACPSTTANAIVEVGSVVGGGSAAVKVYCNGRIE